MEQDSKEIHIGKIIKKHLQERHLAQAVLARRLKISDKLMLYYLEKSHFNTKKLLDISIALKRNLFADIALHLPEHYTKPNPEAVALKTQIAELQRQNELLTVQLNLLKEVMRKE